MARYVALLRAVNVAGHVRIRLGELEHLFANAGARDVRSFGHAGSVLFSAQRGAAAIVMRVRDSIAQRHGEQPVIVVRTRAKIVALVREQPFAAHRTAATDKLYVAFLAGRPRKAPSLPVSSAAERLVAIDRRGRDVLLVSGRKPSGFYGLPNALVETAFGVAATTRNWSTVTRLAALLER